MLVVLDFDGVLFDVERFRRDYAKVFAAAGISLREYRRTYEQAKKAHRGIYNVGEHMRKLRSRTPKFSGLRLRQMISSFLVRRSRNYFFHGAATFLRWCRTHGLKLVLVSTGSGFQREKINASGISARVSKVLVTPHDSKVAPLRRLMRQFPAGQLVYFDDTGRVIDGVKKAMPGVYAVQVARGRDSFKSRRADAIISDLVHARRIIQSLLS